MTLFCFLQVRLKATVLFINVRKKDKEHHMLQNAQKLGTASTRAESRMEDIFTYQCKEIQNEQDYWESPVENYTLFRDKHLSKVI